MPGAFHAEDPMPVRSMPAFHAGMPRRRALQGTHAGDPMPEARPRKPEARIKTFKTPFSNRRDRADQKLVF